MTFKISVCLDFKIGQILIQMVYLSTVTVRLVHFYPMSKDEGMQLNV